MQHSFIKSPGKANEREGFTIVDLLIVIVVIGILATVSLVAYTGIQAKAADVVLKSDLKQAQTQLELDRMYNNSYLATKEGANGNKGLPASPETVYEYTLAGGDYCLTASSSRASTAFNIDSTTSIMAEGLCTGHVGTGGGGNVPLTCPSGFIPVPGNNLFSTQGGFCAMKYEAKNVGGVATSQAAGTPWANISQTDTISTSQAACTGCHLISEAEWLTIAHNVLSVSSNWSGGSVGSGYIYSGHNDNNPANALVADTNDTNGEVIWDMAGNVWGWTAGQTSGGQPGASGYAWRQWNAIAGTGSLSPNPHPNYGTPAASNWTSNHGIGQVLSDSTEPSLRGFLRGGSWAHGSGAGALALILSESPSLAYSDIGFRVAR